MFIVCFYGNIGIAFTEFMVLFLHINKINFLMKSTVHTVQLDLNFTNTRVCLTHGTTRAKKYSLRVCERSGR